MKGIAYRFSTFAKRIEKRLKEISCDFHQRTFFNHQRGPAELETFPLTIAKCIYKPTMIS